MLACYFMELSTVIVFICRPLCDCYSLDLFIFVLKIVIFAKSLLNGVSSVVAMEI